MRPVKYVTLMDGREVDTNSREWMEECRDREAEVHRLLAMDTRDRRRAALDAYGQKYGEVGRERLEQRTRQVWDQRNAALLKMTIK